MKRSILALASGAFILGAAEFVMMGILPDIARSLKTLAADVVFLQEVQGRHSARAQRFADWPAEAQHQYLARQLHARAIINLKAMMNHE